MTLLWQKAEGRRQEAGGSYVGGKCNSGHGLGDRECQDRCGGCYTS
ncbi:hypothetical protein OSCI_3370007 [Kamptonema sp. PCC 6506]|nr:hypothetical protein OSCI_3370007 [Kamptonema sp. PCC 6506]